MNQFLRKLHEERRKLRKTAPDFLRPPLRLESLQLQDLKQSKTLRDSSKPQTQRSLLPKLPARMQVRPPRGSQTERMHRDHSGAKLSERSHVPSEVPLSRQASIAVTSEADTFAGSPPLDGSLTALHADMPEMKFYSLKASVDLIVFQKEEGEEDFQLQVSLALDGLMSLTKLIRKTHEDRIHVPDDPFIFQPQGSPVGTLLMVKLLGSRLRGESQELGTSLVDLSTIAVGGSTSKVVCKLSGDGMERQSQPEVTLRLKISARRKSFTFSYLKADPVFRKAGYEVTADGLCGFPQPYRKAGLPGGIKYSSLVLSPKVSEDVTGLEVYRGHDGAGNQLTVHKYNIMDTACRELLVSELDGLTEMEPGQGMVLCDAFLENMKVCVVLDIEGGTFLRQAIAERGALPEMVASVVLRQVLQAVRGLHETRSRLHNDIDARNVLCLRSGEVRLGGFSYSTKLVGKASKFSGPFVHMAPERLLGLECSFPADVWSLGILAIELALGRCPYDLSKFAGPNGLYEFKAAAVTEASPSLKGEGACSEELRGFVEQCLHKNMRARATPAELLAHPFITKYDNFLLPAGSWLTKKPAASPARAPFHSPSDPPGPAAYLPSPKDQRGGAGGRPGDGKIAQHAGKAAAMSLKP